MSSKLVVRLTVPAASATVSDRLRLANGNVDAPQSFAHLGNYIEAIGGGTYSGSCVTDVGAVSATATITSTGTATNGETASVCNHTLTAKTSGAVPANGEFNISGTVGTQAASIALAINSVVALQPIVTASALAGVVTITAVVPGVLGNAFQISESLTNVTATAFANGSNGTEFTFAVGL